MKKLLSASTIILICAITTSVYAEAVDSLYQAAMTAYKSEDWQRCDSLATQALVALDSALATDWTYSGDREILGANFLGDYLLLLTRGKNSEDRIDVYYSKTHELVKRVDLAPHFIERIWMLRNNLRRIDDIVYTVYSDNGGKHKGIIVFRKDNILEPLNIESDTYGYDFVTYYNDKLFFLEEDKKSSYISRINIASGQYKRMQTPLKFNRKFDIASKSNSRQDIRFMTIGDTVLFMDDRNLFRFDLYNESSALLGALPIIPKTWDEFRYPYYYALRADTLYVMDIISQPFTVETILLPIKSDYASQNPITLLFSNAHRIAHITRDSLVVMTIIGVKANIDAVFPSFGWDLVVSGDYVINAGEKGLQVIHGSERRYSDESAYVRVARSKTVSDRFGDRFHPSPQENSNISDVIYYQKLPNQVLAYKLGENGPLWRKDIYALRSDGLIASIGDKFIWIWGGSMGSVHILNPLNGTMLSDIQNHPSVYFPIFDQDSSLVCFFTSWGESFCALRSLNSARYLRGNLVGMMARSRLAEGDTTQAVNFARSLMNSVSYLSEDISGDLYTILSALHLNRESLRLAGSALISTGEEKWKNILGQSGLAFATDPYVMDSHNMYIAGKNIVTWDGYSYEDYAYNNKNTTIYTTPLSGGATASQNIPIMNVYHLRTPKGPIVYSFQRESNSNRVSWIPMLLQSDGEFKSLQPLLDTYLADGELPSQIFREQWWFSSSTKLDKSGYLLGGFISWGMNMEKWTKYEYSGGYTVGIDITGKGKCWTDSSIFEPVKAGDRFYAHRYIGDLIQSIVPNSQADSLGILKGDIVRRLGKHNVGYQLNIYDIMKFYTPGELLDLIILRNSDTLTYLVKNSPIGFVSIPCLKLIGLDPETGRHTSVQDLPPGFHFVACNKQDILIYQNEDTLFFLDPPRHISKTVVEKGLHKYYLGTTRYRLKPRWTPPETNIIAIHEGDAFIGLDLTYTTSDSERIVWRQLIENVHEIAYTDDPINQPILLKSGILCLLNQETGAIVSRELLPFESIVDPFVQDGSLYGSVKGRVIRWRLSYYHPPFPWRYVGYWMIALLPLLLVVWLIHRARIRHLLKDELALRESENRHLKMVANIGDVIVIIDKDGINRYKSPNIENWFGWKPDEVVGKSTWDNVHPDDLASVQQFFLNLTSEPNAMGTTELKYRCRDGSYKWIEFTAINLIDDEDIQGILGNYHDITLRRGLEQKLMHSDRLSAIGRLAASVAHELNTPLGTIMTCSEGLLRDRERNPEMRATDWEDLQPYLQTMLSNVKRGRKVVQELLGYVHRSELASRDPVDVNGTIIDAMSMVRYEPIPDTIHFSLKLGEALPPVSGDAAQLTQLVFNLIQNSLHAIDSKGTVIITSSVQAEAIFLTVEDDGVGVPAEYHSRIFEPFFTTKEIGLGTGLGLYICREIVHQHGGEITWQGLAQGTRFTVTLPISKSK